MISLYVLRSVFHIRCGESSGSGTAFTLNYNDWQYLVTARHVVEAISGNTIEVFHDGAWKSLEVDVIGRGAGEIDVAVLSSPLAIGPRDAIIPASSAGITIGQQVYFLGSPLEMRGGSPYDFPYPLAKSGVLSGVDSWHGANRLYVDGHANRGFSGGPLICYQDQTTNIQIAGVITSFRIDPDSVNSGIGIAVNIRHVIDLIDSNLRNNQSTT